MINKKIALLLMLSLGSRVTLFGAKSMEDIFNRQVVAAEGKIARLDLQQESTGNTFLHHAVLHGTLADVQKILDHKDSGRTFLSKQNAEGKTALHLAVEKQNVEIVEALLAQEVKKNENWGKEVNTAALKDAAGKTSVALAIEKNNKVILTALEKHLKAQHALNYDAFKTSESIALESDIHSVLGKVSGQRITTSSVGKPPVAADAKDDVVDSQLHLGEDDKVVVEEATTPEELASAIESRKDVLIAREKEKAKKEGREAKIELPDHLTDFTVQQYKETTAKQEKETLEKAAEEKAKKEQQLAEEQSSLSAKHFVGGAMLIAVLVAVYKVSQEVKELKKQIKANPDLVSVAFEAAEIEEPSTIDLIAIVLQNKWNQLVG